MTSEEFEEIADAAGAGKDVQWERIERVSGAEFLAAHNPEGVDEDVAYIRSHPDIPVYIMPGAWAADESGYAVYYPDADPRSAARRYFREGEWPREGETYVVSITGYRRAVFSDGTEWHVVYCDAVSEEMEIDPEEPPCVDGHTHEWSEPDVVGAPGGIRYISACPHCGHRRIVDHGLNEGVDTTRYE